MSTALGPDYHPLKERAEVAAGEPHANGPAFIEVTSPVIVDKRLEEILRFIDRGLLQIPPDADLGRFLVSGGKLVVEPTIEETLTLEERFRRDQAEHPDGVKESSTRSTGSIHTGHLLRIIGSRPGVRTIATETLWGYVTARSKERGRGGRSVSHVTIRKELGTLFRYQPPRRVVMAVPSVPGARGLARSVRAPWGGGTRRVHRRPGAVVEGIRGTVGAPASRSGGR